MKKISILAGSLVLMGLWSCKSTKSASDVIGKIGNDPIYANEFNYVYNKNNANSANAYSKESIDEYLGLYTNFRLKVKEAESLGLDTLSAFKQELAGYKKQLAQPYFNEKELIDQYTKQAYERLKEEVNASHILVGVKPDASPEDTLAAWKKITEIRSRVLKGEDFEQLARDLSEDPSAAKNAGNLGYFTALQMVYPFEDAAYSTPKNSVSEPVRTRFGYHILQVHDRRPSQGQVRTAHLMIRATEGMSESDLTAAKEKVTELYKKIESGEDWDSLVRQFSDDVNTRDKGGELQWFGTGRMIPSFEEAAFSLSEPGAYTEPVQTPYGWHIIKLLERKGLEDFATLEAGIRSKVSRDRSEINKKTLVTRLMVENKFKENTSSVEKMLALADSSFVSGGWVGDAALADQKNVLFSLGDRKYTQADFVNYAAGLAQKAQPGVAPKTYMRNLYNVYKNEMVIAYEEEHLADKHEDYKMLVREYRDGILLFQLMDEKVWSKAIKDTAGLRSFFERNREKYQWKERAQAVVFNVADSVSFARIQELVKNDLYPAYEPEPEALQFDENSDSLSGENLMRLAKLVPYLKSQKNLVVKLSGHASQKESLDLASKRIAKVREYLKDKDIDSVKIVLGNVTKPVAKAKENNTDRKVSFELMSLSAKALEKSFNKNAPLTLQVSEGYFQKGENEALDMVKWEKGSYSLKKDGRYYLVLIKDIEAPRAKLLDETRGIVISDYQEYLEKEWIKELKAKYAVEIDPKLIDKFVKK